MKKIIHFTVVCTINLLALANTYGQSFRMPGKTLKDYDAKNYFPKIGSTHIKDNNAIAPTAFPGIATNQTQDDLQKATLLTRNGHFDTYQLPIDKMPCIVPNNSVCYKMNVAKQNSNEPIDKMPNPIGKQNWITGQLKKGDTVK